MILSCPYCTAINKTTTCTNCGKHIYKYEEAKGLVHFIWGRLKLYDPGYDLKVRDKITRLAELIESIPK